LKELVAVDEDLENVVPFHKEARAPREIWLLTDYLYKNGLNIPHIFTIQRKHRLSPRICAIRDWLDSWSTEPFPGTPQTAAEALLKIFESLPTPLVAIDEREMSIYCAYWERCREMVQRKMSVLNRKIFLYVCLFLKELQKNYIINGMNDQIIGELKLPLALLVDLIVAIFFL